MRPKRVAPTHARWIRLGLGLAVALQVGVARADRVARTPSEGDEDLMARVLGPSADLAQKIVRSTDIAGGRVTLIGFVNAEDSSLVGHLLIEKSPGLYDHLKFPSCEEEGGAPELLAVFFARTVKGGGRDLAVLCRWEAKGGMVNGMSYSAQFYRIKETGSGAVVEPVTDLNEKFQTAELVRLNKQGKWTKGSKAKFKTVAEVKKLLTTMGIKQ
jgi:hypothetical protein